ncbi:hypothetical protein [Caulobacter hibisci]|uniref:Lipoprotein n=1 Tax=Caulobacter hibisci TaxID=2035993 RepID=A0ABS0SX68_9CAUL|nr:hypothetical protein [Caulobacter hibisci]MBI1684206.1 hypothetical protein [Caulobacter hibisci]
MAAPKPAVFALSRRPGLTPSCSPTPKTGPSLGLSLALCALAACGPAPADRAGKPSARPVAQARPAAGPKARKCPDPDNRDGRDPCSASYLAPYRPAFKRDRF